jgi:hypothetical protein
MSFFNRLHLRRQICYWTHARRPTSRQIPIREGKTITWKEQTRSTEQKKGLIDSITITNEPSQSRPVVNALATYGGLRILAGSPVLSSSPPSPSQCNVENVEDVEDVENVESVEDTENDMYFDDGYET